MAPSMNVKSVKLGQKSWRDIKLQKRKWKEEKMIKKLKKLEESDLGESASVNVLKNIQKFYRTCSIAVPGSILQNAQSYELRSYVAGQIARAACIFKINEIIVFNDAGDEPARVLGEASNTKSRKFCIQFARLLQYLECPQYLRKYFFPIHDDLKYVGLMNPLDAPHHLRQDEEFEFREGITTDKAVKNGKGTYVDVGLLKQVLIDKNLQHGLRVTVKLNNKAPESKKLKGTVVPPNTPQIELDTYWGYSVRVAESLSEVFTKSPYQDGYDLTIGTSDKGISIDNIKKKQLKNYKHSLIIFGGLHGLESALESDSSITVENISFLFDYYLNTCPDQGSRTIRTEEAVFITLAELRKKMFFKI